jgi:hypothetical protein
MPWSSSKLRGKSYGHEHAKARKAAAARHDPTDPCVRCGHPLGPMRPGLHYDHNRDRSGYLGFSHGTPCPWCRKRCNLVAAAREGRARQNVSRLRW